MLLRALIVFSVVGFYGFRTLEAPCDEHQLTGGIEGIVLDQHAAPVPGIKVFPFPDCCFQGPKWPPSSITDVSGKFSLVEIQPGSYRVSAVNETQYYPDTNLTFYEGEVRYPVVEVQGGQVVRDVVVRLGPKAARLRGKIVDAKTGLGLVRASIGFYETKGEQLYLGIGPHKGGEFDVLVPSTKAFRMRVSAPGYETWFYGSDGPEEHAKPMHLAPAAVKEILVRVRPRHSGTRD